MARQHFQSDREALSNKMAGGGAVSDLIKSKADSEH